MNSNLMPKIAEMLGVELNKYVTIVDTYNSQNIWVVMLTERGLIINQDFYKEKRKKEEIISGYSDPLVHADFGEEYRILNYWLRGNFRVKEDFPKNGDRAYAFSKGDLICGHRLPHIEEFIFDSSSQFHLLLKEKGLLHETVEEAIKCFEKDYNTFKEMQGEE